MMRIQSLLLIGYLAGLLLSACHDAPRKNPLDPALTPAVELQVTLDESAGTATLAWTPYQGDQPFAAYRVMRNPVRSTEVDTLVEITALDSISYVDTSLTPNTGYEYRVAVVNRSGYENPSETISIAGYQARGVALLSWSVDASRGAVDLRWQQYQGGRFAGYQVERRRVDQVDFEVVAQVPAAADTAYRDEGLDPEVGYFYRITVEAGGESWQSNVSAPVHYSLEGVQLLQVRADRQAGVVRLEWTAYQGPDFQAYRVMRRELDTDQEEELANVASRLDTTFTDDTARHGTRYAYSVVMQAAGRELESASAEGNLELPGVRIEEAAFDSPTAAATLTWSEYAGPRFAAYRVERRTTALAPQMVARIATPDSTSLVDSDLAGNTRYFYRVVVETEAGEEVAGEEVNGIFHPFMDSWQLAMNEQGYVRLYAEPDGRIAALVAEPEGVRLLFFDSEGELLEEWSPAEFNYPNLEPRSVGMARLPDGRRIFSLSTVQTVGLFSFEPDRPPIQQESPLFAEALESLSRPEAQVLGWTALLAGGGGEGRTGFDNVRISSGNRALFIEDFTGEWNDGESAWDWISYGTEFADGWGWIPAKRTFSSAATIRDRSVNTAPPWQDLRLEADVVLQSGKVGIQMGTTIPGSFSFFRLEFDSSTQQMALQWIFNPPSGLGLDRRVEQFEEPFPVVNGLVYRLGLEVAGGQVKAWVRSLVVFWNGTKDGNTPWADLAAAPVRPGVDLLALVIGSQPRSLSGEGKALPFVPAPVDASVSQIRVWRPAGERLPPTGSRWC